MVSCYKRFIQDIEEVIVLCSGDNWLHVHPLLSLVQLLRLPQEVHRNRLQRRSFRVQDKSVLHHSPPRDKGMDLNTKELITAEEP